MTNPRGHAHNQRRRTWQTWLDNGNTTRCGCTGQCRQHTGPCPQQITANTPWHLGHHQPHTYDQASTPWCIRCNLVDGANITNDRRRGASRDW